MYREVTDVEVILSSIFVGDRFEHGVFGVGEVRKIDTSSDKPISLYFRDSNLRMQFRKDSRYINFNRRV